MAKEKMVLFRSSLNGFHKQDVTGYIERMNAEFSERERAYKRRLENAEAKCADLEAVRTELAAAQAEADSLREKIAQSDRLIAEQQAQLEADAQKIESLESVNKNAQAEAEMLSAQLESLTDAIQKSEKYDGISGQIGEIILSARTSAEEIVAKAEKDAEAIRENARKEMADAADGFNARAANAAYAVKGHLKKLASDAYSDVAAHAAETSEILRTLAAHISETNDMLEHTLTEGKTEAETSIEEEAAKLFPNAERLHLNV